MKSFRDDLIDRMKTGWGRFVLASKKWAEVPKFQGDGEGSQKGAEGEPKGASIEWIIDSEIGKN